MADWWKSSLDADLLALALARQTQSSEWTFDSIKSKFAAFERTYLTLVEILHRDNKSIDVLDNLMIPPLLQTLDEYHDFKYDADKFHDHDGPFTKRKLDMPSLPYKVGRYVYGDEDIPKLSTKIDWQIRIMNAKMDAMILSYFMDVYAKLHGSYGQNSSSLASARRASRSPSVTGRSGPTHRDDIVIELWERIDKLALGSPLVPARGDSKIASSRLNAETISLIIEPLKDRLKKTATPERARKIESQTLDQLAAHSQNRLKDLLIKFPDFVTRKRVYYKDELTYELEDASSGEVRRGSRASSNARNTHNHASSLKKTASMKIQSTKFDFGLMTLDIVSSKLQTAIICIDEHKTLGAWHGLPQHSVIFPCTDTQRTDPFGHQTDVCIEQECLVQLTGREVFSGQQALVTYRFPLTSDMFAFQSAIRGRLIRHVFDVEFIKSNRGTETTHQHVKIWSDSNNDNFTLSFYVKEERSQGAHLEFPIACFLQTPATHKTDPHFVRIYFRLRTQPPMLKTSSGYPTSEASSPLGTRARQERRSFSSSTSPTLSMFKIFTKSPQPKNTTPPLSPPTERIQQRENSTSGSAESQSTNDTTIGSMASIFPAQDLKVDPHSEAMQHLDFRFNFASDAGLFTAKFREITSRPKPSHFRGNSIYNESSYQGNASKTLVTSDIVTSSEIDPYSKDQVMPEFQQLPSPAIEGNFDLGKGPSMNSLAIEDKGEISTDVTRVTSQTVYRVRGIPIGYQVEELRSLLASKLLTDPAKIDIRSLATNPSHTSQTATVIFEHIPSPISSDDENWEFRWNIVQGKKASHIHIDTHFHGLTMLYSPPENIKHEIDICAVAGLGESAFETFEERGRGGSYMWILDLLLDYFAGARIMLYGCPVNAGGNNSSSVVKALAGGLIASLNDLSDDVECQASGPIDATSRNVPLIFIGYSLAGQVIKQAMVITRKQQEDAKLYKSVCGALFFGVPSQAMERNALESILKDHARFFSEMSDEKYVQTLNDKFDSVIRSEDLHMQYFYETERTPELAKDTNDRQWKKVGSSILVVPQSSATNTSTSEDQMTNQHAIKKDHLGLVKWRAHDLECLMAIKALKLMKTKKLAKQRSLFRIAPQSDPVVEQNFQRPQRSRTGSMPTSRTGTGFQQPSRTATGLISQTTIRLDAARAAGFSSTKDYHVGWICAVGPEYVAALQSLDVRLTCPYDLPEGDENAYSFGIIGDHHVVIAGLAKGKYGLTSAASAATDMMRSFTSIGVRLMVGIAGGAPSAKHDIRLGDVVVSVPVGQRGGVLRYDFGRTVQNKKFALMGSLNSPPELLLKALTKLSSLHEIDGHKIKSTVGDMLQRNTRLRAEYQKPDPNSDVLYKSSFIHSDNHKSCMELCFHHQDQIVARAQRDSSADDPAVHFGLIASGDQLMKDAVVRDALVEKEEVLCFEMEAAGLMARFPCLVIRGICDYSDTHKNDKWQGYAAATAAAYARELLLLALKGKRIPGEEEGDDDDNYDDD